MSVFKADLPFTNPVVVFVAILFIILFVPLLFKRFKVPGIIGLILSGVLIGPHGFNIIENGSAMNLLSTIGLLYIMFIAGLELDMTQFKIHRNKSILFGTLTFIMPLIIGYPVCFYLLGYDFNASFLTASMFATHTLVAYPIVSKMGIAKNQAVAITVGGTILTDTAVLIILEVILGNSSGNLNGLFWIKLISFFLLFSFVVLFIIPKISKWFFIKMESDKQVHYIYVLFIVFFSAFLAEIAGLEPIIGAFFAGLALNKLIPHSSSLMNRIEFIGNSLFIPIFLVSVGMIVNLGVIFNGHLAIVIALVLSVVALTGKWVAAFITQLLFGYSANQRRLIFGLSSAHAAATLAVILIGYRMGVLTEDILNGTIILILITCLISSFVTEKASREIVIKEQPDDIQLFRESPYYNEHILLPVANHLNINKLLELALIIKDKSSVNPVSILSVVRNDKEAEMNIIKSRNQLEVYLKEAAASEVDAEIITTIDYNPAGGIARTSREIMADMIIIGWPKRTSLFERLMGYRIDTIIENIDNNLFVCKLIHPLLTVTRIVLITPHFAEKENGFDLWVKKVVKLSKELSVNIFHLGDYGVHTAIGERIDSNDISSISFKEYDLRHEFSEIANDVRKDDLIVCISAQRGSLSHSSSLDSIPVRIDDYFRSNNKIVVYPQQFKQSYLSDEYF